MSNDNHIALRHEEGVPQCRGCTSNVAENLEEYGLDPILRQVLLAIAPILKSDPDV